MAREWRANGYVKDRVQVITTKQEPFLVQLWCKACGAVTEMPADDVGTVARPVVDQVATHVSACEQRGHQT